MNYTIPRSRAWGKVREAIRPLLKKTWGGDLYGVVTEKWFWAVVFFNYIFMRNRWLRRWFKTGVWSQTIYVEGTNICNAACVFCAYPQMERAKMVMSMEHFKSAIDQWIALRGDEVDMTPIVGDPFVDRFLFERLDYLRSRPEIRKFHFFTNAILMKSEYVERLCGYGSRLQIYCSFGGFDRQTYHKVMGVDKFDEAVSAISRLIETKRRLSSSLGIQVNLRAPLGSPSGEFWDYLLAAKRDGVIVIDGIEAFDSWAGAIKGKDLQAAGLRARPMKPRRGPCRWLITGPAILVDGRVNACTARDVEASLIIGDLKTQPLSDILSGEALQGIIAQHDAGKPPPVCSRCTYYNSLYPGWLQGRLFPMVSRLFR